MRVLIDEEYLEDGAAAWWKKITPAKRAIFIQSLWECGNGSEDGENPHEEAIQQSDIHATSSNDSFTA